MPFPYTRVINSAEKRSYLQQHKKIKQVEVNRKGNVKDLHTKNLKYY